MDYTSIHIYGHLLSDDILRSIEQDNTLVGNREQDYSIDSSTSAAIDYVWSSLRNDWHFYQERSYVKDPYGTRKSRDLMERLFLSLGYELQRQQGSIEAAGKSFEITYTCPQLANMPFIVIGDKINDNDSIDTLDKCSLDYRAKGQQRKKSSHATMLEYLNSTENVYGIISNGQTLRLIRNSGQLVKLTYIEFDLRRMLEEDKYTEFCLMFRLLHSSRFRISGDEQCVLEKWFNLSIESGNRIREGLSKAVQQAMETIGNAAVKSKGCGNESLRHDLQEGTIDAAKFNKELIHFIYRILFLFIIEDRNLVYQIPDSADDPQYKSLCNFQELYKKYYAASRLRGLSELNYLRNRQYFDIWKGLMDTFRLFESGDFGEKIGIKPLGGVLFDADTLHYLKQCEISNSDILAAFSALNEFIDDRGQRVKINYSSLDVEEFGSVYEGILEMRPFVQPGVSESDWQFGFVGGLDRQSTSSYYTRPDLVQSLIRTTLEPVIKERIAKLRTPEEKVKSLLSMKVCDAASGSGHIVLAMARTIAWYVCTIRTGEDNPASLDYREALREVIQKCVYAVDYNPDAVELCKVVLWIEGYCAGKPLSFLDHHIRCGNSVVGVTNLDTLLNGVPKEAFTAVDNDTKRKVIDINKEALRDVALVRAGAAQGMTISLFTQDFTIQSIDSEQVGLAGKVREITELPENSLLEQLTKQSRWEELMKSPRVECLRRACDVYTYAYYKQFKPEDIESEVDESGTFTAFNIPYTRTVYQALQEIKYLDDTDNIKDAQRLPDEFRAEVANAAKQHSFFHWCVEFPEVFAYDGGFDVMCGNPPWDKLQMEDEKWFVGKDQDIVNAPNQSARDRLIAELAYNNLSLYEEYLSARKDINSQSKYIKHSGRFKYCNRGKIELSSLFAESYMLFSKNAWGIICPTNIAFSDGTKYFIEKLTSENRLSYLYSFENEEHIFQIAHNFKFCMLVCGSQSETPRKVRGGFYLRRIEQINDPSRIYTLQTDDFAILNPNTKTCPIFRTKKDAEITRKIYRRVPILMNESENTNPWGVVMTTLFNMASDSCLYKTEKQIINNGGNRDQYKFNLDGDIYVPLYEGKLVYLYNHHFGQFPTEGNRPNAIGPSPINILKDTNSTLVPWYWIKKDDVDSKFNDNKENNYRKLNWNHKFFIGFRDVTSSTSTRTCIVSLIPARVGVGDSLPLIMSNRGIVDNMILLGMMSSLAFDFVARQKVGGNHLNLFMVKQLPFLSPDQISYEYYHKITKRIVQLCYFNHDLDGWAEELWNELTPEQQAEIPQLGELEPFVYDPDKRAVLQAELDAIFAHLYGLSTEDLRYILDPEDVCGPGCINETFRVLKDNETREFGEYRTKRLVMEAWYKFGFDN